MIPVLSSEQIKEWDLFTIENEPISSIELMERASTKFVDEFIKKFQPNKKITIVCGHGNNGGDGLAIARILKSKGYLSIDILLLEKNKKGSEDFEINFKKTVKKNVRYFNPLVDSFENSDIIIDAIFGSGLNKAVEGVFSEIISQINNSKAIKVSVDIPSGLMIDELNTKDNIVKANYTYTFQNLKKTFLFPESETFTGEVKIIDIELHPDFLKQIDCEFQLLDLKSIKVKLKKRKKFSHKGTYGHSLIVAGSYGKMGAAVLSTKSCLKSGAGLVTSFVPTIGYDIMQNSVPEAMVVTDRKQLTISDYKTIAIGPGLGTESTFIFEKIISQTEKPIVIDADGINILSKDIQLLKKIPKKSIFTPHVKELERLIGKCENSEERLKKAMKFAVKNKLILVLKGAYTAICLPNKKVYFNTTGNPGMATAGSGDVLTGMITGFLSQNYSPENAAILGVYVHGLAGDLALEIESVESLLASNLIDNIGKTLNYIKAN